MTTMQTHHTTACVTIAAPAEDIYRLLTDVDDWPVLFPWIAHTEVLEREAGTDLVTFWAVKPDGTARIWTSRRTLDQRALRMDFTQLGPVGPIDALGGTWTFHRQGDRRCRVETRHWFTTGGDPGQVAGVLERNSDRQLGTLRAKAERRREFAHRVLRAEAHRDLAGDTTESYARLLRSLDPPAAAESAEFLDVVTCAPPNGEAHPGRTLRITIPGRAVVEKVLSPSASDLCLRRRRLSDGAGGTRLTASIVLSTPQTAGAAARETMRNWATADLAACLAAVER